MGYDAAIVAQVERRAALKRYASHPLFVWSALTTWFRHYDHSRPRFAVHHPDGSVVDDAYFAICFNTNPYTYLGTRPLDIAPDAGLDRGLVMVTVRSLRLDAILSLAALALAGKGRVARSRHVVQRTDLASVVVRGHGPFPYQVDGDHLGDVEELVFRHEPEVLDLVLPDLSPGGRPEPRPARW
jgi:hypothetical protein